MWFNNVSKMIVGFKVWHKGKQFLLFWLFHILIPYNIILVYLIFMSLIVLYFLHSTWILSFYIDVVLTLSISIAEDIWWNISLIDKHIKQVYIVVIEIPHRKTRRYQFLPGIAYHVVERLAFIHRYPYEHNTSGFCLKPVVTFPFI